MKYCVEGYRFNFKSVSSVIAPEGELCNGERARVLISELAALTPLRSKWSINYLSTSRQQALHPV